MSGIKDKLLVFIPGLALLFFNYGGYWSAHWYSKWTLLVGIFSIAYSWMIAKRTTFFFFPIICLSLLSATWGGVSIKSIFISDSGMSAPQGWCLYSYLTVIMATMTMAFLPKRLMNDVRTYLAGVSIFGIAMVIASFQRIAYERGAMVAGNASMSASMIACTLPFLLSFKSTYPFEKKIFMPIVISLAVIACLMTHSSIGVGTLLVVLVCYALRSYRVSFGRTALAGAALSAPVLLALKYVPLACFSSSGRVGVWRAVMVMWYARPFHVLGVGLGSGVTLFPAIQQATHASGAGFMLFLHSEPIQVLFELGYAGAASALIAVLFLCFKSWKSVELFSSLVGFLVSSVANYPLRLPVNCTVAVLLSWLIIQNKRVLS